MRCMSCTSSCHNYTDGVLAFDTSKDVWLGCGIVEIFLACCVTVIFCSTSSASFAATFKVPARFTFAPTELACCISRSNRPSQWYVGDALDDDEFLNFQCLHQGRQNTSRCQKVLGVNTLVFIACQTPRGVNTWFNTKKTPKHLGFANPGLHQLVFQNHHCVLICFVMFRVW